MLCLQCIVPALDASWGPCWWSRSVRHSWLRFSVSLVARIQRKRDLRNWSKVNTTRAQTPLCCLVKQGAHQNGLGEKPFVSPCGEPTTSSPMATVFGLWSYMGKTHFWPAGERQVGLRNVKQRIDCGVQAMRHRYRLGRIDLETQNRGGMIFGSIFSLTFRPRAVL